MFLKVIFLFVYVFVSDAQFDGERCVKGGVAGICRNVNRCQSAIDDIKNRINPQLCSFNNTDPIVCCLDAGAAPNPVATTTSRPSVSSSTEYIPPFYDYESVFSTNGTCEPIPEALASKKTGQKAFDKCIEYQEKYVYPCEEVMLTGNFIRSNRCHHSAEELIISRNATQFEFPHMVMIGYGANVEDVQYKCGGAIISERFILTAGHCTNSRDLGPITYIAVGVFRLTDSSDRSKVYKVKNITRHPEFKPPAKYNNIALVETETPIALDQFIVPACLPTGDPAEGSEEKVKATGWGLTRHPQNVNNTLQKVVLQKISTSECMQKYKPLHHIKQHINAQSQTCYVDKSMSGTCLSDGGGPIQIKNMKIHCMYNIVGVTSFGNACGFNGEPGIYTRVLNYVPWIESIVWPN